MKKILVVDDSKTIRTVCEVVLRGLCETLVTVDSIAAAKSEIAKGAPEVVVLDYTLEDGDSNAFCKSLSADGLSVIILGGKFAPFDEGAAIQSGASSVVMKPFKSEVLLQRVREISGEVERVSVSQAASVTKSSVSAVPSIPSMNVQDLPSAIPTRPEAQTVRAIAAITPSGVSQPSASVRRFNFPAAPSPSEQGGVGPKSQIPSVRAAGTVMPVSKFNTVPNMRAVPAASGASVESATPKTPLPTIPPSLPEADVTQQFEAIDPGILRAEVQAAVKEILPSVVRSVLKKLIVTEVTPQIQTWVDNRVESLVKKMIH